MVFDDLQQFLAFLAKKGELVRVSRLVDPVLEINAILDRLGRSKGPAVMFENVKGSSIPVVGNVFGTMKRISWAFGCEDFEALVQRKIKGALEPLRGREELLLSMIRNEGVGKKLSGLGKGLLRKRTYSELQDLLGMVSVFPITAEKPKCREVVLRGEEVDLTTLPALKLWPKDGGRFITLPLVMSKDPETGEKNVGIYRMQILDKRRTCMHWLPRKHGAEHFRKAESRGKPLQIAVAIGCDPSLEVLGCFPLLPPLDEFMMAGFLRGHSVKVTRSEPGGLHIPAHAEIVLEGIVEPGVRATEGPFGEFHGYYAPPKQMPVFEVHTLSMRKHPVWHAATTGRPSTEIHVLAKAIERFSLPVAQTLMPDIVDINATSESGSLYTMIISLRKTKPYQAQEVMHFIWSIAPQNTYITNLVVVDEDIDVHNLSSVLWAVSMHFRPERDLMLTPVGMADMEKPGACPRGSGAKMGIDATRKWKEEDYSREAPELAVMDPEIEKKVERLWAHYGFSH